MRSFIFSALTLTVLAGVPTIAMAETGVTNSYSTRCITNGKYRSDFKQTDISHGVKNSYEGASKVEVGSTNIGGSKSAYIATSSAYSETKSNFSSVGQMSGSNDYDYTGAEYNHSVSSFSN